MSLRERLKRSLKQAGISQSELARRCGVTRSAVSLWLSGTTYTLEGANLTRAAIALGVSPHWLSTGEGSPVPARASLGSAPPEELVEIKRLHDSGKLSRDDMVSLLIVAECLAGKCGKGEHDATKAIVDFVANTIRHS